MKLSELIAELDYLKSQLGNEDPEIALYDWAEEYRYPLTGDIDVSYYKQKEVTTDEGTKVIPVVLIGG